VESPGFLSFVAQGAGRRAARDPARVTCEAGEVVIDREDSVNAILTLGARRTEGGRTRRRRVSPQAG
jgi:hypothetical protein